MSDPTRIKQILGNVIGNAIKFTPFGEVTLSVSCAATSGDASKTLLFEVSDSGIGMTPIQKERLFAPFSQADSSMTRKYGGTGLGLLLSRKLARSIGGELTLKSTEAQVGSVFEITIPTTQCRPRVTPDQQSLAEVKLIDQAYALVGYRILVVEDSSDNQVLIGRYLKYAGAVVECRGNGQDGIEAALSGDYDVVLMDIQMPIMEGSVATTRLRERGYSTPIIALTAHAMRGERERSMSCGFSEYLTKPIDKRALIDTIKTFGRLN